MAHTYNGIRWHERKDGYFSNSRHGLLHRYTYEHEIGPIPEGAHVHHIDHDKANNDAANLIALTPSDHWGQHAENRCDDWHSRGGKAVWEGKEPTDRTCELCGDTYQSRATKSRWCGERCRDKGSRKIARRVCVVCGDEFTTEARRTAVTCSPPCRSTYSYTKRR